MVQYVLRLPSGENTLIDASTVAEILALSARYAATACLVQHDGQTLQAGSPLPPALSTLIVLPAYGTSPGGGKDEGASPATAAWGAAWGEAVSLTQGFLRTALHSAAWQYGARAGVGQIMQMGGALVGLAAATAGAAAAAAPPQQGRAPQAGVSAASAAGAPAGCAACTGPAAARRPGFVCTVCGYRQFG